MPGWSHEHGLFLGAERFLGVEALSIESLTGGRLLHDGDSLDPWHVLLYFLIGGIACCISHASVCPVDVVKTRQQSDPELYRDEVTGEQLGMGETCMRIVKSEGPLVLFTGLEATAAGYFVQGSFKYGLWYVFKFYFGYSKLPDGSAAQLAALVLAAFCAELFASTLLCPYERARIRVVNRPDFASSTFAAVRKLQSEDGFFGGLFGPDGSALAPTLLKMCSYTTTQLTVFQLLIDYAKKDAWAKTLPWLAVTFPCAVVAAILATLASQPGDALQTQASTPRTPRTPGRRRNSMTENAQELGWKGLTNSWHTRIVMFSSMVVVQLLVYDALRFLFGVAK